MTQDWALRAREVVTNTSDPKVMAFVNLTKNSTTIKISYLKKFGEVQNRKIKPIEVFKDYLNGNYYCRAKCLTSGDEKDFSLQKIQKFEGV